MDLPYPTQKQHPLSNRINKSTGIKSLILRQSQRHIPQGPVLPNSLRKQIKKLIMEDYPFELKQLIDRQVINLNAQVGEPNSLENLLHLACKFNSVRCLDYLIKNYFQFNQDSYQLWINASTHQAATPAIICVINMANSCLQLLLKGGGVDIHLIDSNKLSPYQLALNTQNQQAVKMLMDYQASSISKQINKNYLMQPYNLIPSKPNFCQNIYKFFLDCFCLSKSDNNNKYPSTKILSAKTISLFQNKESDKVIIGYQQYNNSILWVQIQSMLSGQKNIVLFDTFNPYDIEDTKLTQPHLLSVIQSLSQHPWLVRRIIQSDKKKQKFYNINIFPKQTSAIVNIDNMIPVHQITNQPLFITSKKQAWPVLLQKALAKFYGSYLTLNNIKVQQFMQTLTGWPVFKQDFFNLKQCLNFLQKIHAQGCMILLEGKQGSLLGKPEDGKTKINYFSLLNFYSKNEKKLILVNCPFIDPAWIQKQRHEILALKMLRGHFNAQNQMTVWIEQSKICEYFSNVLFCPIKSQLFRHSIPLQTHDHLFFRVQFDQDIQQQINLSLREPSNGELLDIISLQGWYEDKQKIKINKKDYKNNKIIAMDGKAGQYFLHIRVPQGKYQIIIWGHQQTRLHAVQQCFGIIQWLSCWKNYFRYNWDDNVQFRIQKIGDCSLFITKSHCTAVEISYKQILQGKALKQGLVQLQVDGQFRYCVIRGQIIKQPIFHFN